MADSDSVYHYFAKAIALRKDKPALVYGDYRDLDPQNPAIFAYTRTLGTDEHLVVLNFSRNDVVYKLPHGVNAGRLLISNLRSNEENVSVLNLQGWEARVYSS